MQPTSSPLQPQELTPPQQPRNLLLFWQSRTNTPDLVFETRPPRFHNPQESALTKRQTVHSQFAAVQECNPLPQSPRARVPRCPSVQHTQTRAHPRALGPRRTVPGPPPLHQLQRLPPSKTVREKVANEETDPMKEKVCVPLLRRPRQAEIETDRDSTVS